MANLTRDLVVNILADTSQLNAGLAQTNQKLSGVARGMKAAGAAAAAFVVARPVIDFLGDSTQAAIEDTKAQELLATALRNTTEATDEQIASVEKFIGRTQNATGVLDDQLRPAFGNLVRATNDIEQAQALMATALDISAAKGMDLETVSLAIAKAQDGQTTSLARLGVQTKDTSGATLEFDQIMQNANATFGGAAQTAAETTAGKMAILQTRFEELKENIGNRLLPVFEGFGQFLVEDLLPAIENIWPVVDRVFGLIAKMAEASFHLVMLAIEPVLKLLTGDWAEAWDAAKEHAVGIFQPIIDGFGALADLIGGALGPVVDVFQGAFDTMLGIVGSFVTAVGKAVDKFVEFWLSIPKRLAGLAGDILDKITGGAGGLIGKALGAMPFEDGGHVTRTGLALVHQGETITPAGKAPLGSGSGSTYITVNALDPAAAANAVVAALNEYGRRNGGVRVVGGMTAVS